MITNNLCDKPYLSKVIEKQTHLSHRHIYSKYIFIGKAIVSYLSISKINIVNLLECEQQKKKNSFLSFHPWLCSETNFRLIFFLSILFEIAHEYFELVPNKKPAWVLNQITTHERVVSRRYAEISNWTESCQVHFPWITPGNCLRVCGRVWWILNESDPTRDYHQPLIVCHLVSPVCWLLW